MKKIKKEEIQPLLLNILKVLKGYFDKNNLQFYLIGGTLLGAIRHQGFIPWDDDIDVIITKDVYKMLLELVKKDPFIDENKRYRFLLPSTGTNIQPIFQLVDTKTIVYEKNVEKQYANGLWVDIFCLSYWPDDHRKAEKIMRRQKRLLKMLQLSICGNLQDKRYKFIYPFVLPIKKVMLAFGMNSNYWSMKLLRLGDYPPSQYIGNLCWASNIKDRYPKEYFRTTAKVWFEGEEFDAPGEYVKILTQFYGNYMQLPPEKERVGHTFIAYFID